MVKYAADPTFARASTAYLLNGAQAASGVPRYDLGADSSLAEEGTQNLLSAPEDVGTGPWQFGTIPGAASFTADAAEAPDGSMNGNRIAAGTGNNTVYQWISPGDALGSRTFTFSVWLKRVSGGNQIYLTLFSDGSSVYPQVAVDLTDVWTRYYLTMTVQTGVTAVQLVPHIETYGRGRAHLPAVTFDVWGAQVEEKSYMSSYTPTARLDQYNLGRFESGVWVEEGTTNVSSNPSAEVNLTGWGATYATDLVRVRGGWIGSYGVRGTTKAGNATQYFDLPGRANPIGGHTYTNSLYVKAIGSAIGKRLQLFVVESGGAQPNHEVWGDNPILTGSWQRLTVTKTVQQNDRTLLRAYVYSGGFSPGDVVLYDGHQDEEKPMATSYCEGTRAAETLTIPTAGVLPLGPFTWEQWTYITPKSKSQSGYPFLFSAPRSIGGYSLGWFHSAGSTNWEVVMKNDAGSNQTAALSDSYTPDGWHYLAVTYDGDRLRAYVDGVLRGTGSAGAILPSGWGAAATVGYQPSYTYPNVRVDELRISSLARTATEIAAAYRSGTLEVDQYTTYKMNFDSNMKAVMYSVTLDPSLEPPYEVRVLNQSMQRLAVLETYASLIWTRRFQQANDFVLTIPDGAHGMEYLVEDNLLQVYRDGVEEFTCLIEHGQRKLDEKGRASEFWEFRGSDVVTRRTCLPPAGQTHDERTGPAETVLKGFITANIISPTDTARTIDLVTNEADSNRGSAVTVRARYEQLTTKLEEAARAGGIGWELVGTLTGLQFKIIPGQDKSAAQSSVPPVIFSPDFGNVKTMEYLWSSRNRANVAYTGGKGEGLARTIREVYSGSEPAGLGRREAFIDARDLELAASLDARGLAKLLEQGPKERIELEILTHGPFKYRDDWDLGDIVTVRNLDWGVTAHVRVVEVRLQLEGGKPVQYSVAFGAPIKNFIEVIRQGVAQADIALRV